MQANGGLPPASRAANYLSKKNLGPSSGAIVSKFTKLRIYQHEVAKRYQEMRREIQATSERRRDEITRDIQTGEVPLVIYFPTEEDVQDILASQEIPDYHIGDFTLDSALSRIGEEEIRTRHAKYKVTDMLLPHLPFSTKMLISLDAIAGRNFIGAIRKHRDLPKGDIEYAALTLDVFDDIWPMDNHLESLKLDEGYREYCRNLEIARRENKKKKMRDNSPEKSSVR